MPAKTPLSIVKEQFGEKSKLVEALQQLTGDALWVARTNKAKGLEHVSNAKLLRLHATFTTVKEKFGTREKLIDAILELEKRSKDAGLRQRLLEWPVPRLFDTYKSAMKRKVAASKAATAKPAAKAIEVKAPPAKSVAKKTPSKKAKPKTTKKS